MNHHSSPRTMRRLSVVALSGALLLAGCGDDGDDEAKDDTATTASAEDAGIQSACDAYTDISKAMGEMPERDPAVYLKETVMPLVKKLDANKPAEVEGEVDTMVAAATKAGETGDMSAFEAPEFAKAQGTVCLLYTSDAADERSSVDLGGRRIIKKKKRYRGTLWTGLLSSEYLMSSRCCTRNTRDGYRQAKFIP